MPDPSQDIFSPRDSRPLPQYGFGAEFTFDDLIENNPFLFKVYSRRPSTSTTDAAFVAQAFNENHTVAPRSLRESMSITSSTISANGSYADVARHMDWTTRSSSPYISTSFSFTWAIWEATRRYRLNFKHDIEIAVIDARAVAGRAVTALELLRKSTPKDRHKDYWKWYHFAIESQDVLVHGFIPNDAVLTSIPLLPLLERLPSYFMKDSDAGKSASPFDRLAWDSAERKPSYRQFCQDMSERFLRMPPHLRLRDTTGGSVRLAVEFLRPWFHREAVDDFGVATTNLCNLAFVIAQWPGQWWAHDRAELWDVIRSMVQPVGEEVRAKQQISAVAEVKRLQGVVHDLEQLVHDQEETLVHSRVSSWYEDGKKLSGLICPPPEPSESHDEWTVLDKPDSYAPSSTAVHSRPVSPHEAHPSSEHHHEHHAQTTDVRPHSMAETVSCVVTGFLFGSFITLCIISSQRRTLITNLY